MNQNKSLSYDQRAEHLGFDPLMSTKEAALYLGMHVQTIKVKAMRHEIPTAGAIGRGYRFRKSSIDIWLRGQEEMKQKKKRKAKKEKEVGQL